jgi:ankyrin repeat protein
MDKIVTAAKNGDVAKVKECLEGGIDPDGPAKDGRTPLIAAVGGGHLAVVEALLAAYADPTLGKGEETPMTIAFQKGKQDILKVLFSATFASLDSTVNPGVVDVAEGGTCDTNVPDNAMYELKNITTKIATINSRDNRPESPGGKYGNYASLLDESVCAEKDSDSMREASVRLAMKSLSNTTLAGKDPVGIY